MTACRFIATDQARVLPDQHLTDCNASGCPGCKPCPARHCTAGGCPGRHLSSGEALTCAKCVGQVRKDLALIAELSARPIAREAEHRGVASEAMMLAGPAANAEAWSNTARSAMFGRISADYLEDCRDELHPLWVLGTWDMLWREHLDHPTDAAVTVTASAAYLDGQLTYMAQQAEPDFGQFATEVRACRGHLEDVLRDGERVERGSSCAVCGDGDLVKVYGDVEADDRWKCDAPRCDVSYTEGDYRAWVDATYVEHATELSDTDMHRAYRVKPGSVRAWAALGKVARRGKRNGRQLYDVADVLAMREQDDTSAI